MTISPKSSVFPEWALGGLPGGDATRFLRVDFRTEGGDQYSSFESLIETKTPRLAWARATICPCKGFNDQTGQTDPSCPVCNATGWAYFRPQQYVVDEARLGSFDPLQQALLEASNAVVIRGFFANISATPDMFQALGNWAFGSATLTVRPANRLGYYDRITQIDEVAVFSEVVVVDGPVVKTRYPVRWLNYCMAVATAYGNDDLVLYDDGTLRWRPGKQPTAGTRVSVHYMHHPTWVMIEYGNLVRTSLIKFRKPVVATPDGDILDLPIKVIMRREHLQLDPERAAPAL